jgi:radical SAM superfamily enzyme YgiQ (UPF0313 family)
MTTVISLTSVYIGTIHTPLALLYLRSVIQADRELKDEVEIHVHWLGLDSVTNDIALKKILAVNPDIVAFSCYVWNIKHLLNLAYKIKKIRPCVKIVLGGPQVTPVARRVLEENPVIDIIVRGEGEQTFLELVKLLKRCDGSLAPLRNVQGITYRDDGAIMENPCRALIADVDSIPSAYFQSADMMQKADICLETMRGCPFRCSFCYYTKGNRNVRYFSVERIKEELEFILKQDVKRIYLMDPTFNIKPQRSKEILRFVANKNTRHIPCHTELKAEFIDDEIAELLSKANVVELEIGLQSTNRTVLKNINRARDLTNFSRGIKKIKKYRNTNANVSIIYGLPGATVSTFKRTVEFLLDLDPNVVSIFRLCVLPGTEMWERAEEFGIEYEQDPPYRFIQSRSFSFDDVLYTRKVGNSLGFFRTDVMQSLREFFKLSLWEALELWFEWIGDDEELLKMDSNSDEVKNRLLQFVKSLCVNKDIIFRYEKRLRNELNDMFIAPSPWKDTFVLFKQFSRLSTA